MDVTLLHTKKVSVIGAARSGVAVAMLLKSQGADVYVSDSTAADKLQASLPLLQEQNINYEAGGHTDRVYECELMVISPGVPSNAPVVLEAQKRKIKVVSELEAGSWFCRAPIVAITGSNGKTTTTTLIGRMLADAKKPYAVAGNIGEAFSNVVEQLTPDDVAVLEVSSFQLDFIRDFRPAVAVMLNITRNHLDRYGNSMERYAASKARIFMNQQPGDLCIYNAEDALSVKSAAAAQSRILTFSMNAEMTDGAFTENGSLVMRIGGNKKIIMKISDMTIAGSLGAPAAAASPFATRSMATRSCFRTSGL